MNRAEAKNLLLKTFIAEYGNTTPVAYDNNEDFEKPKDSPWVRFSINNELSNQRTLGIIGNRRFGRVGLILYQVFIPNNIGTYDGDVICEQINNIFEGIRLTGINCWAGDYREIGINPQDYYQFNGSIPYDFDETK